MRVLVPIGDGSEEIETSAITDVLVRGGVQVTVASVMAGGRLQCKMARGLNVVADVAIAECAAQEWDAIALPGGMPGAQHLSDCETLVVMLKAQLQKNKTLGAVCAAPSVVLARHGLLPPKATCFPIDKFKEMVAEWSDASVVVDGCVVTSQGPGTSLHFALKLVEILVSREKAEDVAKGLLTTMP